MKSPVNSIFLSLLFIATAGAQSQKVVTLDNALKIAMERNLSVIQQQNIYNGQQYNVLAAYGNLMPTVGARGSWDRTWSKTQEINIQGVLLDYVRTATVNNFNAGASASWVLFNGFANTAGVNRALSGSNAAEQTLYRTKQTIVYQTYVNYLNVQRTEAESHGAGADIVLAQRELEAFP